MASLQRSLVSAYGSTLATRRSNLTSKKGCPRTRDAGVSTHKLANTSIVIFTFLLISGCVNTPSMGRMHPLMPAELEVLDCESITLELKVVDQFCEHIDSVNDVSCKEYAASTAGLIIPVVQYGVILTQADSIAMFEEAKAAMKSASVRRAYLTRANESMGCEASSPSRCPLLCDVSNPWQVLESGFWCGDKCVRMSRGERKAHADILQVSPEN